MVTRREFLKGSAAAVAAVAMPLPALTENITAKTYTYSDVTIHHRHLVPSDLTLDLEEYSRRYIRPAIEALAKRIDHDLLMAENG